MPIYEYGCSKCGHEFEAEQRITDNPLKTCPECRSRKLRRLISRTSFVLKGSGWYADLYSSPGSGSGKKAESGEKPAADSGGDATASATPAASDSPSESSKSSKSKTKKKGSQAAA